MPFKNFFTRNAAAAPSASHFQGQGREAIRDSGKLHRFSKFLKRQTKRLHKPQPGQDIISRLPDASYHGVELTDTYEQLRQYSAALDSVLIVDQLGLPRQLPPVPTEMDPISLDQSVSPQPVTVEEGSIESGASSDSETSTEEHVHDGTLIGMEPGASIIKNTSDHEIHNDGVVCYWDEFVHACLALEPKTAPSAISLVNVAAGESPLVQAPATSSPTEVANVAVAPQEPPSNSELLTFRSPAPLPLVQIEDRPAQQPGAAPTEDRPSPLSLETDASTPRLVPGGSSTTSGIVVTPSLPTTPPQNPTRNAHLNTSSSDSNIKTPASADSWNQSIGGSQSLSTPPTTLRKSLSTPNLRQTEEDLDDRLARLKSSFGHKMKLLAKEGEWKRAMESKEAAHRKTLQELKAMHSNEVRHIQEDADEAKTEITALRNQLEAKITAKQEALSSFEGLAPAKPSEKGKCDAAAQTSDSSSTQAVSAGKEFVEQPNSDSELRQENEALTKKVDKLEDILISLTEESPEGEEIVGSGSSFTGETVSLYRYNLLKDELRVQRNVASKLGKRLAEVSDESYLHLDRARDLAAWMEDEPSPEMIDAQNTVKYRNQQLEVLQSRLDDSYTMNGNLKDEVEKHKSVAEKLTRLYDMESKENAMLYERIRGLFEHNCHLVDKLGHKLTDKEAQQVLRTDITTMRREVLTMEGRLKLREEQLTSCVKESCTWKYLAEDNLKKLERNTEEFAAERRDLENEITHLETDLEGVDRYHKGQKADAQKLIGSLQEEIEDLKKETERLQEAAFNQLSREDSELFISQAKNNSDLQEQLDGVTGRFREAQRELRNQKRYRDLYEFIVSVDESQEDYLRERLCEKAAAVEDLRAQLEKVNGQLKSAKERIKELEEVV